MISRQVQQCISECILCKHSIRRLRKVEIEQAVPLRGVPIGHIYFEGIEEVDSDGNIISNGERIDQPSPSVANVAEYTNPSLVDNVVKKREVFLGERWAIGIKDMALATANYDQSSTLVSFLSFLPQRLQFRFLAINRIILTFCVIVFMWFQTLFLICFLLMSHPILIQK